MPTLNLRGTEPITFERADGSLLIVPPATRGQIRRVIQCETDAASDPMLAMETRSRQVAILCEHATCNADATPMQSDSPITVADVLDDLNAVEEAHILNALVAQFSGYDPALAVHVQQALEKKKH